MSIDSSNWMSDALAHWGNRPLHRLVLPASHHSGLYQIADSVPDAEHGGPNACIMRRQTGTILDQLEAGIRFFDIRPVLWHDTFHTGHYRRATPGYEGCNGTTLNQFFAQVAAFLRDTDELVVLKFSHSFNRDTGRPGFDAAAFARLFDLIAGTLGPHIFALEDDSAGLARLPLQYYLNGRGRVLCVFAALPGGLRDPARGIFSVAAMPETGDLKILRKAPRCHELRELRGQRKRALADAPNHGTHLYQLAWTLTLTPEQDAACRAGRTDATSALDLAAQANSALQQTLEDWIDEGVLTGAMLPNLICVDAAAEFCLQTALYLNRRLGGPP